MHSVELAGCGIEIVGMHIAAAAAFEVTKLTMPRSDHEVLIAIAALAAAGNHVEVKEARAGNGTAHWMHPPLFDGEMRT